MGINLVIVARDTVNTGGGHVIEQLCKQFVCDEDFSDIVVFTDYFNENIHKLGVRQITMPLGDRLHKFESKNRFLKITRHFLQVLLFSFYTLKLKRKEFDRYIIIDSNNEGLVSDISLTHDVFFMTLIKDIRRNNIKIFRILNPVLLYKIIKEFFNINKPSTKCIISISNETLEEVSKINFTKKRKIVIGHGVDLEKFYKPENKEIAKIKFREKYRIPNDAFVLLLSGHEYERKGLKYVIEALSKLPEDVVLVVTGGGKIDHYKNIAEEVQVGNRVYFLGLIENIIEAYHLADLFVLPTSYEGWGLVATEAMGTGLPVLISKVGGVKDYLIDNVNGVPISRNSDDIANKILMLKNNRSFYEHIQKNGLETAKKFSWINVAKKYKDVIKSSKDQV